MRTGINQQKSCLSPYQNISGNMKVLFTVHMKYRQRFRNRRNNDMQKICDETGIDLKEITKILNAIRKILTNTWNVFPNHSKLTKTTKVKSDENLFRFALKINKK